MSGARATAILFALAAVSTALHAWLVGHVSGAFVFMDELGYERMAQSFARTGHFALFGEGGLAYSPLYPIVLSPIYALTSSMETAYEWAKVENSVLISLAVFPIYGIARSVLSRGRSLGVAALSLAAPLMLYSSFEMSESLAYPLCLVAIWTILRAVRRPCLSNDALMAAAILLAAAARLQLIVLLPAALTAFLLEPLARPHPGEGRPRAIRRTVSEHRALFGVVSVALVAGLVRTVMNGGNLPLAGRYANVGTAHASAGRVVELFFQHLAELDFAVAVIPFATALLAGYSLVRSGFPRRALIFASVAAASVFWFLLEVALDAAAFDAASNGPTTRDLPRIHERYLIYLTPFFLVAVVAALRLFRTTIPRRVHVVIAIVAAALPTIIPFGTVINETTGIDSFALLEFVATQSGATVPVTHATTAILLLSSLLAVVYFLIAAGRLPPLAAVLVTAVALLGMSAREMTGLITPPRASALVPSAHPDWVDRAVGSDRHVSLVGDDSVGLEELVTAFWNGSIAHVYTTCGRVFGRAFGEQQLPTGSVINTRYAVVPASMPISGRVIARNPRGKLVLVAPTGGTLRIPSRLRCRS